MFSKQHWATPPRADDDRSSTFQRFRSTSALFSKASFQNESQKGIYNTGRPQSNVRLRDKRKKKKRRNVRQRKKENTPEHSTFPLFFVFWFFSITLITSANGVPEVAALLRAPTLPWNYQQRKTTQKQKEKKRNNKADFKPGNERATFPPSHNDESAENKREVCKNRARAPACQRASLLSDKKTGRLQRRTSRCFCGLSSFYRVASARRSEPLSFLRNLHTVTGGREEKRRARRWRRKSKSADVSTTNAPIVKRRSIPLSWRPLGLPRAYNLSPLLRASFRKSARYKERRRRGGENQYLFVYRRR